MPQSLTKLYVHIVFSTKGRFPFFTTPEIIDELCKYLAKGIYEMDSYALEINAVEDHVHILCNLSKKMSISNLIAEIKRSSSKWLKTKGNDFRNFYWQRGYGAFSVSESLKDITINYIRNQKEHHNKKTFKKELLEFLEKYEIEYDEKYLWD